MYAQRSTPPPPLLLSLSLSHTLITYTHSLAFTAHAAATLWSLCVDMDHIKPAVVLPHPLNLRPIGQSLQSE